MKTIQRYHMTVMDGRGVIPIEHEIGEWVKHADHVRELAALRGALVDPSLVTKLAKLLFDLSERHLDPLSYGQMAETVMYTVRAALNKGKAE